MIFAFEDFSVDGNQIAALQTKPKDRDGFITIISLKNGEFFSTKVDKKIIDKELSRCGYLEISKES